MIVRWRPFASLALTLLLALATVVTDWTVRPLRPAEEAAIERFVLQGGSLADLCDETGAIGKSGSRHGHDCQSCCLSGGAALLPGRMAEQPVPIAVARATPTAPPLQPVSVEEWNAARPRGPPSVA